MVTVEHTVAAAGAVPACAALAGAPRARGRHAAGEAPTRAKRGPGQAPRRVSGLAPQSRTLSALLRALLCESAFFAFCSCFHAW